MPNLATKWEPGAWASELDPPEPLDGTPLTAEGLRNLAAQEGLGFCIYSLIPASLVKDVKLRFLWARARRAMQDVVEYMEQAKPEGPEPRRVQLGRKLL